MPSGLGLLNVAGLTNIGGEFLGGGDNHFPPTTEAEPHAVLLSPPIPCFIKSGPLCIFAITFSNVERFE